MLRVGGFLLAVLAFAGCAVKPRPPAFNLYERERLVVLPFENVTQDPALGKAIQDDLLTGLVRLNAVPVAEQAQVATMIEKIASRAGDGEAELRGQIKDAFKCDLIMVGSLSAYHENVRQENPKRIKKSYKHNTYKWGYRDSANVNINTTVKIIDAATGNLLWITKALGRGVVSRWVDLPWPGENASPPKEGWETVGVKTASRKDKRGKGRGDPHQTPPPGTAAGTPAAASGQQPITIIIQNTQQQQTTQVQTQTQAQAQAQSAAAPERPKLLYQSDANVFRARQHAINDVVRTVLRDFRGRGGWQPTGSAVN